MNEIRADVWGAGGPAGAVALEKPGDEFSNQVRHRTVRNAGRPVRRISRKTSEVGSGDGAGVASTFWGPGCRFS